MNLIERRLMEVAAAIAALLLCASVSGPASAQEAATPQASRPAKDYNQRSLEIFEFRKAARSGVERGQEIFYYKCWFCHNEYVKEAPHLKGLYQKPVLGSGQPVNDATVKEKIRNGGPAMAAYKYTLSDDDLNDLVSYIREKCCWDSDSPPSNPRYRAN
jgi:mono/diheme cytochrome c family protein